MLNICIVFAQLERETIQRRVRDAYYSRCEKGFHMGGPTPYGYKLEKTTVDGVNTKMLAVDPVAADQVKQMFEMYARPQTSLAEIAKYFTAQGISHSRGGLQRSTLSVMLRNPVYAQADLDLYEFFKSQGAKVVNDASDFGGTNGCYLFQGRDIAENKDGSLKGQILAIAPHEGIVPSETWLACRKRLMGNTAIGSSRKAKNSWLAGKIKCGVCGGALIANARCLVATYFRCRRRADNMSCKGCGVLKVASVEKVIYGEMCRKMADYRTLTQGTSAKSNPKLTALKVSLAQAESEIEKLLDTLREASATLVAYANSRIEELDARRQSLVKQVADLSMESISPKRVEQISHHLDTWDTVSFDDRRLVVDGLISLIKASSGNIKIEWKI